MSQKTDAFINQISRACIADGQANNLLPSVTIAQAAEETGWGTGGVYLNANNLFGSLITKSWTGRVYVHTNGISYRAYDSIAASLSDRAAFLKANGAQYGYSAIFGNKDYKSAAHALESWNGTGDNAVNGYSNSIIGIIESNDLTKYDEPVFVPAPTPAPPATKHSTIRQGSSGNDVKAFQNRVNQLGYRPLLVVDGIFGAKSKTAALWYQKAKGLVQDGIVGPKTWAALGV
jgi:hypothetical protein